MLSDRTIARHLGDACAGLHRRVFEAGLWLTPRVDRFARVTVRCCHYSVGTPRTSGWPGIATAERYTRVCAIDIGKACGQRYRAGWSRRSRGVW